MREPRLKGREISETIGHSVYLSNWAKEAMPMSRSRVSFSIALDLVCPHSSISPYRLCSHPHNSPARLACHTGEVVSPQTCLCQRTTAPTAPKNSAMGTQTATVLVSHSISHCRPPWLPRPYTTRVSGQNPTAGFSRSPLKLYRKRKLCGTRWHRATPSMSWGRMAAVAWPQSVSFLTSQFATHRLRSTCMV